MERVGTQLSVICERNGLEYRTWDQIIPYFNSAREFYKSAMNIALLVILAIVILSIANTMIMAIFDRMREIATIHSLGTTSRQIFKMMGVESALLGLLGCIAGIGIAYAITFLVNSAGGIPLPPPPGNSRAYRGMISISFRDVTLYSSMIILASFLSSIYPSIKAVRMSIADIFRWN
jgi:putative ABC transport system permease protein